MIGKTLSHYRIVDKLGAGGMGEVWRATDSKLGRDVALKMLPEAFASDPERLARFQREAQLLASLNHPNIAAIYGLEEVPPSRFLVLELVEGPTLEDRLRQGPLPVADALALAHQIAEAVESAHEKGIVHRDLKPGNVKLTGDARAKVLDFGLAKALEDPTVSASRSGDVLASPTMSPTLSSPVTGALTAANVILGTAAYMSPEQARGQGVDRRADIWAFGVILFEMLTGRRLFTGETVSDTLASVLKTDPEWSSLPADTPPAVRRLLRRCLRRNPQERLRDIGDARLALAEVLSGAAEEDASLAGVPVAGATRRRTWLLPAVALVAAGIGAGLHAFLGPETPGPADRPLRKYEMAFPEGTRVSHSALAPDASAVAFFSDSRLHVREFLTGETRTFEEVEEAEAPFWSPDGEWIGYGARSALWKVRRTGGSPVRVAALGTENALTSVAGAVWRPDGRIFFTSGNGGVLEVSAQGGDPTVVVPVSEEETDFHELADLDGRAWAAVAHRETAFDTILALLPDGSRKVLASYPGQNLYDLAWSRDGYLLFRRTGDAAGVWALPLSSASLEATGEAFLVAANGRDASVTADGTMAFVKGFRATESVLAFVDRSGVIQQVLGTPGRYNHFPELSPDGKQIACRVTEAETRNQWIVDVDRGSRGRFTTGDGPHERASWSADGQEFWYYDELLSGSKILVRPASGAGEPREVTEGWLPHPTADGNWLVFTRPKPGRFDLDVYLLDLRQPDTEPTALIATDALEIVAVPSPTDPLLAYNTDASGRDEIYLTTFPEMRGNWLVSTGGGFYPKWRRDGRELYYAVGDSIMAVEVDPAGSAGNPGLSRAKLLFRRPRYLQQNSRFPDGFDVTADGQSFVMNLAEEDKSGELPAVVIVQSWLAEFREDNEGGR